MCYRLIVVLIPTIVICSVIQEARGQFDEFPDVNDDGMLAPMDVLNVINQAPFGPFPQPRLYPERTDRWRYLMDEYYAMNYSSPIASQLILDIARGLDLAEKLHRSGDFEGAAAVLRLVDRLIEELETELTHLMLSYEFAEYAEVAYDYSDDD